MHEPGQEPVAATGELTPDAVNAAPVKPRSETDQLIADLNGTLTQLQKNEPDILNTLKQYRVELAQRLADLRSSLARSGKSLDEVRSAAGAAASETNTLRMRRVDRRCSELRVYIEKLQATRDRLALMIEDHQYVLTDLQTKQRVDQLIDPALLEKARGLLEKASDQNELSPQNILDNPELVVAMVDAEKATADAIGHSILPERAEKKLDDLPALPELDFETADAAEKFLLADLQDHLTTGKTAAEQHLAANRPEAAIEEIQETLKKIRTDLEVYPKPVTWKTDCLKQLDATKTALSEQLAGPYLAAVEQAIPEARTSHNWNGVLDLLEAVVRLAPAAEKLPAALATLSTILDYRVKTNDFDAAVAWERLQEIKALLSGTTYRPVSFAPLPLVTPTPGGGSTARPAGSGGQLHGVDLDARQTAQNALGAAGRRYHDLEAGIRSLLLKFKPTAPNVVAAEHQRTAALEEFRQLLAARDAEDSRVFNGLEEKIAERRAARTHLTSVVGLREDSTEVKQVDGQVAAIQQSQAAFRAGHQRATRTSPNVDIQEILSDPRNRVTGEYNSLGMLLVGIPAGTFQMGSPANETDRDDDENQVSVTISRDFLLGAHEVTVGQVLPWLNDPTVTFNSEWVALDSDSCPVKRSGTLFELRGGSCPFGQSEDQPMVVISWTGATAFCEWLSKKEARAYRLPTEAEWEYAYRAGTTTAYYWGADAGKLGDYAWHSGNAESRTHPVGQKLPNDWGLFDMAGNTWEWCADWYGDNLPGGTDPRGAASGSYRVNRGGGWGLSPQHARSALRSGDTPGRRYDYLGFRVLRSSGNESSQ